MSQQIGVVAHALFIQYVGADIMDGGTRSDDDAGCIVGRLLDPANNFYRLNAFAIILFASLCPLRRLSINSSASQFLHHHLYM